MSKFAIPVLATFAAAVWLWAWNRFVPRPPDRLVKPGFMVRPTGSLVFFGLLLFYFVPKLLAACLLGFSPPPTKFAASPELYVVGFAAMVFSAPVVILAVLTAASAQSLPWIAVGVTTRGLRGAVAEGVRSCFEWFPLVASTNTVVRLLIPKKTAEINPVERLLLDQPSFEIALWAAAAAVIAAPIIEEMIFRGLLQTWFGFATPVLTVLCSSVIFAAIHWNAWPDPIALVLVGIMLGLAYQRTQVLLAPVVAHSCFNGVMTVVALLAGDRTG